MSPALLFGSLIAVFGLAAVAHLCFPGRVAMTPQAAVLAVARSYPDAVIRSTSLDSAKRAAFLELRGGYALAQMHGDKIVCRMLERGQSCQIAGDTIRLSTGDITAPHMVFATDSVSLPRVRAAMDRSGIPVEEAS